MRQNIVENQRAPVYHLKLPLQIKNCSFYFDLLNNDMNYN